MLIRRHPKRTSVTLRNLCDLPQTRLEVLSRLILHTTVLDEAREVVFAILAYGPTEIVDVAIKAERTGGCEVVSEEFLDFGFEDVEAHAVNGVFQTSVLTAIKDTTLVYGRVFSISGLTRHGYRYLVEPT